MIPAGDYAPAFAELGDEPYVVVSSLVVILRLALGGRAA
jgi:hypothetical protein